MFCEIYIITKIINNIMYANVETEQICIISTVCIVKGYLHGHFWLKGSSCNKKVQFKISHINLSSTRHQIHQKTCNQTLCLGCITTYSKKCSYFVCLRQFYFNNGGMRTCINLSNCLDLVLEMWGEILQVSIITLISVELYWSTGQRLNK